ncbi:MAG TPA: DUF1161 domain-containing protein [Candidatus Aquilonibacter sp.]|nr:DUF1161 domain-containing protein [Candidatus Aquilonibacter sp.]
MKTLTALAVLLAAPVLVHAQAKSCDDLKAEIAKKIEANGVKNYTLDIVDKGAQTDGKVVGTCGGGTKEIVYSKTAPAADSSASTPSNSTPAAGK